MQINRTTKANILFNFPNAHKPVLNDDMRKNINDDVPEIILKDLEQFHNSNVKNTLDTVFILGDKERKDFNLLAKFRKVRNLSHKEIFGY